MVYACVWGLLTLTAWLVPSEGETVLFESAAAIMLVWAGFILLEVIWQDRGRGTDTFWRTRPAAWSALWTSQWMFLLLFLAGPPVLCWAVNGFLLGNTPAQWAYGTFDLLKITGPLAALAGIASFSTGLYSLILALVIAVVSLGAGWLAFTELYFRAVGLADATRPALTQYGDLREAGPTQMLWLRAGWAVLIILLMLSGWAWSLWRLKTRARAITIGMLLFLTPLLGWWAVPAPAPPQTVFQAQLPTAGTATPPGFRHSGVFLLKDVPEDTVPIISHQFLRLRAGDSGEKMPLWGVPYGEVPDLTGRRYIWTSESLAGPSGKLLRSLLPEDTRWYLDETRYGAPRDIQLYHSEHEPLTGRITGEASGFLLGVMNLLTVPLEAGPAKAENGVRMRIRSMEVDDEILALSLDIRQTSCGEVLVPPEGFAGAAAGSVSPVPVLYFPSVPMALLALKGGESKDFRSWQTRVQQQWLRVALPEAEAIRGVRFTPGVMRGAQLMLCATVPRGTFTVALPTAPQTLEGAPESALSMRAAGRFQSLGYFYNSPPATRGERVRGLKAMGADAMRGILEKTWMTGDPPLHRKDFDQLKPELQLENFIPELSDAIRRDPRWMYTAWFNGVADRVEDAALAVLRTRRQPLSTGVVASAAAKAVPADYSLLQNHIMNATPFMANLDPDFKGPLPGRVLWQHARGLPGFDWRMPVRELWRAAINESHPEDNLSTDLRDYAALAGDSSALNLLLDSKWRDDKKDDSELTTAEWKELMAMIDGLPAGNSSPDTWLSANQGYFTWDETARKYRVLPRGK
jgi:hypothetical protein